MYETRERKGYKRGTAQNFLHSFPLSGTPVVQSYWAWTFAQNLKNIILGNGNRGTERIILLFGGGGGETYYRAGPPMPFLEIPEKWDWSGQCRCPLRDTTGRRQNGGGETYHRLGGGFQSAYGGRELMVFVFHPFAALWSYSK